MKLLDHPLLKGFSGPVSRTDIVERRIQLPQAPGVYVWCFRTIPPGVPALNCLSHGEWVMLYVGISPDSRSKPNSRQGLRSRIRHHLCGNAEGSTLRRTLGILLLEQSGFPLRRVGSGKRITLTHLGEQWLDRWLDENALLLWRAVDQPWHLEEQIIADVSCPLNLRGNEAHPFNKKLKEVRYTAISEARKTPVADEGNQSRNPRGAPADVSRAR
jgi:hypothetical protein